MFCKLTALLLVIVVVQVSSGEVLPIRLSLSNDDILYAEGAIGNPHQKFNFLIDSGSSMSWIISKKFEGTCKDSILGYDNSRSITYAANGKKFQSVFVPANLSGFLSEDSFSFNGVELQHQVFAEIDSFPGTFMCWRKFSGLLGLGLAAEGEPKALVQNLIDSRLIPAPIVSLDLKPRTSPESVGDGGSVVFGAIDTEKFTGKIEYIPSTSDSKWQIDMSKVTVKSESDVEVCEDGCSATVESGLFSIFGPIGDIRKINSALGAQESTWEGESTWTLACETKDLPNVVFTIGDKEFELEPKDYLIPSRPKQACFSAFAHRKRPNEAQWILGAKFIQKFYTVFQYQKKQIGFATKKQ